MNRKIQKNGKVFQPTSEEVPTIMVNSPSTEEMSYADQETSLNSEIKDSQCPNEDVSIPIRRKSLRRNSISLPNLDDLQVLKDHVEVSEQDNKSESTAEDEDEDDDEIPTFRTPLRNVRRKSVLSPRMLRPPEDEENGSNSPANSVTSVNSLASLLREKIQTLPQTFRKKKTTDYKTRIFVILLFIAIVVMIIVAYFLYHQKVLQKSYFGKIKFNNVKRLMKIYNNDGTEVLIHGHLGTTLNYDKVLPCLPADKRTDGSICFEWMDRARLYLHVYHFSGDVKCYNLNWISLSQNVAPTDCYAMGGVNGHWYGGGQTRESTWPLDKGGHVFSPFVTGRVEKHQWGNVLKRYFINSKGAAILVDDVTPLHISITGEHSKELCLRGEYDDFAFVSRTTPLPHLNYSICTRDNMTELHSQLTESTLWDGLKKEDIDAMNTLLSEPLWEIKATDKINFTEETISKYAGNILELRDVKQGHVLINEFWQNHIGDFQVDKSRFPTLEKTREMLRRRGFRMVFSIQPFISTESSNFADAVKKRLLVSERYSDRRIPALTRYKTLESAGMLDITNSRTMPWLIEKLKKVMEEYQFNAYYLDLGIAYNLPHYYQCEKPLTNPDQYKTLFISNLQASVNILGVSSAVQRPKPPSFVSLPPFESSWDGLKRIIPTILTYGILGYPFIIPGAVGGDYEPIQDTSNNATNGKLKDPELYLRWLQLSMFLPVVRYTHLPSDYGDQRILDLAKNFSIFRENQVAPILRQYASVALNVGLPIIRPLWMLDSSDPACHTIKDEFSIGEKLIVAPILQPGARQREVYLPAGVWKDGIDKSLRKGNRWIHDYPVDEHQIAYFEKMPNDTRF